MELVAVYGAGLISAASPCLLPLYPAFLAYLTGTVDADAEGGQKRKISGFLGVAILLGVLTVMLALGLVFSLVKAPIGQLLVIAIPVIGVLLVILGVMLLVNRNPFMKMASFRVPGTNGPVSQAYVYGLFLGPIAIPCAGPFLVATLAIAAGAADTVDTMATFVVFGFGFGMPLVLLSVLARARQDTVVRFITRYHSAIELASGVLLILAGIWYLWINWETILFTFDL